MFLTIKQTVVIAEKQKKSKLEIFDNLQQID